MRPTLTPGQTLMRITHLTLPSSDPEACLAFYRDVLQLPVEGTVVRVGWTEVEVVRGSAAPVSSETEGRPTPQGDQAGRAIHLAFNIPPQRFDAACDWLARRALILRDASGTERFELGGVWQSRSVYFAGPHDAVLELIARNALLSPCAVEGEFHGTEIVCVSEVGLPTRDVLHLSTALKRDLGIESFGEPSEGFSPLGDDEGLFIVVDEARSWFPEGRLLPTALGVRVTSHVGQKVMCVDA